VTRRGQKSRDEMSGKEEEANEWWKEDESEI
jgi:hypothetical protein